MALTQAEARLLKQGVPQDFAVAARNAAVKLDVPLAVVVAVGETESGWRNVWGHDPGKYREDGLVTEAGVRRYFAAPASRRPNGIGPMQLTGPGLQAQAMERGGIHLVANNVYVGTLYLKGLISQYGTPQGLVHYNGSGPAARAYGGRVLGRTYHWEAVLHPAQDRSSGRAS